MLSAYVAHYLIQAEDAVAMDSRHCRREGLASLFIGTASLVEIEVKPPGHVLDRAWISNLTYLQLGFRAGVIAAISATSHRLHVHIHRLAR
jgi:hypothetical protein